MTPEQLTLEIRKVLLMEGNLSETQAAKIIGMTQQNFSQKLKAGTLRYLEVHKLLTFLGYKVEWSKDPQETK